MNFNYSEADEYEADFATFGTIEFDELDAGADADEEILLLAARVEAARHAGA